MVERENGEIEGRGEVDVYLYWGTEARVATSGIKVQNHRKWGDCEIEGSSQRSGKGRVKEDSVGESEGAHNVHGGDGVESVTGGKV